MGVVVDLMRCQGYAQCAYLAPDVFRMRGDEALMYDPEPGEAQRERVLRAAAACPVQAIRVDQINARDTAAAAMVPESAAATAPSQPVPVQPNQPRATTSGCGPTRKPSPQPQQPTPAAKSRSEQSSLARAATGRR